MGVTMDADPWKCQLWPLLGTPDLPQVPQTPLGGGAAHLGMTNCRELPSPEDPEGFWVLGVLSELAAVGGDLACPVVSGNVSLYNESLTGRSRSPLIAVVGLLERKDPLGDSAGLEAGSIFLVGEEQGFFREALTRGLSTRRQHPRDLQPREGKGLHGKGPAYRPRRGCRGGRAVAGGGLLVALEDMPGRGIGISLDTGNLDLSPDRLFGEWGAGSLLVGRIERPFPFLLGGFPARRIGKIAGGVRPRERGNIPRKDIPRKVEGPRAMAGVFGALQNGHSVLRTSTWGFTPRTGSRNRALPGTPTKGEVNSVKGWGWFT